MRERVAPSALFAVDVSSLPGETVLTLHGELDISTRPLFASALAEVDQTAARIVLDLSDLTFIDSANSRLIHQSRELAESRGANLEVRSPNPQVLPLLELIGLVPRPFAGQRTSQIR